MRETNSDCKVCSQHKRKRVEEEKQEEKKKKKKKRKEEEEEEEEEKEDEEPGRKTEEESEEAKGVNSCDAKDGESKEGEHSEAKHCEQKSGTVRRQTSYYCKTCSGEPSLCPVPCFELYHTRLIYKSAPEPEAQAS
ncbi:histone H3.v1-like [Cyclopterus lumpus]|uniref:histone H3.v1-like n=1 Tax=Cyclopterus lumpus TaxID=8103 RepID=UPI001486B931|nr:histone H3.v1-like [Cyclopterus lumpus]